MEHKSGLSFETLGEIDSILNTWNAEPAILNWPNPSPAAFDEIELTNVPQLIEWHFTTLQKYPLFYNKDFHRDLANQCMRVARKAKQCDAAEHDP